MARVIEYTFPASNTQDVCAGQASSATGNYILNGNLANTINSEVSFIDRGYSRNISITSAADVSAFQFTITGLQNGQKITEVIAAGPNNTTLYGGEIYDSIISVAANAAVVAVVSIGSGLNGFFKVINVDLNNYQHGNSMVSLVTSEVPPISTTIYGASRDITKIERTYLMLLTTNIFHTIKNAGAVDNYFNIEDIYPYHSLLVKIDGAPGVSENSVLYMNFTQATQFQS